MVDAAIARDLRGRANLPLIEQSEGFSGCRAAFAPISQVLRCREAALPVAALVLPSAVVELLAFDPQRTIRLTGFNFFATVFLGQ
jgi:hypothetical protein